MATQASGITAKQPRWHPHYDDESADIVFMSNDGTKFGMSLKLLAKTSTVFAGMLSLPPSATGQQQAGQLVDIDYDQTTILLFIELVSIHDVEFIVNSLGFTTCRSLLPLMIQFDCRRLQYAIRQRLYESARGKGDAWELLLFGAHRDDWEMGRQGLKRMFHEQVTHLLGSNSTFRSVLETLPAEWQFALSSTIMTSSFDLTQLIMDWSGQASKFHRPGSLADKAFAASEHGIPAPTQMVRSGKRLTIRKRYTR